MHWKEECEAVITSCNECHEPLYDNSDPDKFHECAEALARGIDKRTDRL